MPRHFEIVAVVFYGLPTATVGRLLHIADLSRDSYFRLDMPIKFII